MNNLLRLVLTLALLTSSAIGGEPTSAKNPQEIPSKIDPDFKPEPNTNYVLTGSRLYRPPANNPGPMEASTSIAWSYANEFVYRTALAKDSELPAVSAGLLKDGWYSIGIKHKNSKLSFEVEVNLETRVVRLP